MARITEDVSDRIDYLGKWMELYYALDADLPTGDVVLTSNWKIPNENSSVLARLSIAAIFDANTTDNSNSFKVGGSWPAFNGSVSISSSSYTRIYNNTVLVYPLFGQTHDLHAVASLSGIDRVKGIASFDRWLSMPPRAWATPAVPTVTGYSFNGNGTVATVSVSGHQRDTAQDQYWQNLDYKIHHGSTGWVESLGLSGGLTEFSFSNLVANSRYDVDVRTWNEDGGASAWSSSLNIYTKPNPPTITKVKRKNTDHTKVDISFTNGAAYPGTHKVERRMTPSDPWSFVGNVSPGGALYTDTVPTKSTPEYRVRTASFDDKLYSDYSNILASDAGTIKQYIPGVNSIYVGGSKVTKVMLNNQQIWLDY